MHVDAHSKSSCRNAAAAFAFVTVLRLLFLYISGSNDTGVAGVPILIGILFFAQLLVELILCHSVMLHDFAFQVQAAALDNRNADGFACFRS